MNKEQDYNIELDSVLRDVDTESFDLYGDDDKNDEKINDKIQNSDKEISKDMMIEEIVNNHPDIVPMLMDYGVHCVGCGGASFETLEEGFMGHGMSMEDVDQAVLDLNEYIKNNSKDKS